MEIKEIKDLLPYQESLRALWEVEEFQPLLSFLSNLRKQKEDEFWMTNFTQQEPEQVKAVVMARISELRVLRVISTLPDHLDTVREQLQARAEAIEKMKAAGESNTIGGAVGRVGNPPANPVPININKKEGEKDA